MEVELNVLSIAAAFELIPFLALVSLVLKLLIPIHCLFPVVYPLAVLSKTVIREHLNDSNPGETLVESDIPIIDATITSDPVKISTS